MTPDEELPKLMTASDKEIWARFAIALIPFHTRREPTYEQHEFIDMDGLYGTADLMFNEMQRRCEGVEAAYGLGGKGE